ncbi:MAG: sugar phosphate isomerase/epimerase [Clostridiales bacterium]|nr:sugar phosphate isomerase/epimerase [Clostridiales bacterium]
MKFGACVGLDEEKILTMKELGFDYFETHLGDLAALSDRDFSDFTEKVETIGLPCEASNCFIPSDYPLVGEARDYKKIDKYVLHALDRAHKIGIKVSVFGSSAARKIPQGVSEDKAFEQIVFFLADIVSPIAESFGIEIAIEPLNKKECAWINSLEFANRISQAADKDNIKILADLYHMHAEGENVSEIIRLGNKVVHAHIANPVGRLYPSETDGFDYIPFLKALNGAAVSRCSIEASNKDFPIEAGGALGILRRGQEELTVF